MSRHDISDEEWAVMGLLSPQKGSKRARPRHAERRTLNGGLYVLKTGWAWEDLSPEYGSGSACGRRLNEWSSDGSGLPVDSAQAPDITLAEPTLQTSSIPQKRGRPKTPPIRTGAAYHQRWKVERCFGRMDHCRRLVV